MLANLRNKSSLFNEKCTDCFLRFTNNTNELGCLGLNEVPDGECRFHKTFDEQQQSLMKANRLNAIRDLRVF